MKKNYLIALMLLCFILIKVQAQKIVMDKDTVMKDGVKLFIVKTAKKVSILDTEGIPEYSIRNMDNKELIYFKDNSLIFLNNGAKATYDGKPKALPLAKHINEHELITNNQLNETAQNNYLIKFAYKELVTAAKDANGLIVRNRTAPVIISGNTIKQDNVIVGKITQDTRYNNGISEIVFEIKQPDGTFPPLLVFFTNIELRAKKIIPQKSPFIFMKGLSKKSKTYFINCNHLECHSLSIYNKYRYAL